MRTRLRAAAMLRCWRWVFSWPIERERRMPKARTPCEIVASLPERAAYCLVKAGVVCRSRAACKAWYCSCGRTESSRRGTLDWEWVHCVWEGQAWQSLVEKRILMLSFFRLSMVGVQLMLVCPCGQVACL